MGKLTHHNVKRRTVQPLCDREEFPNELAAEGEAVFELKSDETGAQKQFCTPKIPLEKWCHPTDRRIGPGSAPVLARSNHHA